MKSVKQENGKVVLVFLHYVWILFLLFSNNAVMLMIKIEQLGVRFALTD